MENYDVVIIGAGIYGIEASMHPKLENKKVLIIEKENDIFLGASYTNQARLHNGYHYPRSYETVQEVVDTFESFAKKYEFAINSKFKSIYAIAKEGSQVNAEQFEKFCDDFKIPYKRVNPDLYFKPNTVEASYETVEYVFDSQKTKQFYLKKLKNYNNITFKFNLFIEKVKKEDESYLLTLNNGEIIKTPYVINTTYAAVNTINRLFGEEYYEIKYQLCEMILGKWNVEDLSITVMDGKFFSCMPFGKNDIQTLTTVGHTPHETCYEYLPKFSCQENNDFCSSERIGNCNLCPRKPQSRFDDMMKIYKTFMKDDFKYEYNKSLFTIKPTLIASEVDDGRPTIVKKYREKPTYISCLSGKFSTIYMLDEFLNKDID